MGRGRHPGKGVTTLAPLDGERGANGPGCLKKRNTPGVSAGVGRGIGGHSCGGPGTEGRESNLFLGNNFRIYPGRLSRKGGGGVRNCGGGTQITFKNGTRLDLKLLGGKYS